MKRYLFPVYLLLFSVCLLSFGLSVLKQPVFAQTNIPPSSDDFFGLSVANAIEIDGDQILNGHIISFTEGGYTLSKRAYDPTVYAIVTTDPAVTLEVIEETDNNLHYVVTSGKTPVLVTTSNGPILTGDLITASDIPGIGMKADADGYVVGVALEDYTNENPDEIGEIMVNLNFAFNSNVSALRSNLLENLNLALSAPFLTPTSALRYILAGLALLISFALGMGYFGRVTQVGVEALGRNPLAGRAILVSVIINMLLALLTIAAGVGIGYLILVL